MIDAIVSAWVGVCFLQRRVESFGSADAAIWVPSATGAPDAAGLSSVRTPTAVSDNREGLRTILKAARFAAHKHKNQRRKDADASPYINHPIALANIICDEGDVDSASVIAAALLHDTIEDTETDYDELRGQFGDEVAEIVAEVTDTKWLKKTSRKRLQISKAARASNGAKLVKLADKISNLRDIIASSPSDWSLERKREYFDSAKRVVDQIRGTNAKLDRRFDRLYRQRP